MVKIKLIKLLDTVLGIPAAKFFPLRQAAVVDQVRNVLLIRPGGIGDAVLLIPAIQEIKHRWPRATICVLAEKRNAAVFQLCPDVDTLYHYDKPRELFTAIQASYDVVIDTEQWHRLSAVIARMAAAPVTIGFATNERKKLFTHPVRYSHDDHELNSFQHLLAPIGNDRATDRMAPFLIIPRIAREKAITMLSAIASRPIVVLFPGGSIAERRWGAKRFHLAAELLNEKGYRIAVVGGRDDVGEGEEIIRGISHSLNLCGKLSLPETAAVLASSSLLITGDSGIMHIGYGLGIKIIALFGPGREKKWAPTGKNCRVINKHLVCSPCTTFGYTPKCRLNAECMRQITEGEVFTAAMEMLESSRNG